MATDWAFVAAMTALGWHHDEASNGFEKGEMWVSYDQAQDALEAAEIARQYEPQPVSRLVAEIVTKVAN